MLKNKKKYCIINFRKYRKGRNMIKKISIFIIILTLIFIIVPKISYAAGLAVPVIDPGKYNPGTPQNSTELNKISDTILGVIYYIGVFLSVGILMVIGIKYITGSASEKAQYKETMVPYLIGAVLLFGGINILKLI